MLNILKSIRERFSKRPSDNLVLEGESDPLSREQMIRLQDALMISYKQHEDEKRRSLGISAGFYEKLAALDAGSIAVAASITLTILLKSEIKADSVKPVIHELLFVVACLWASLVLSILHNFLATIFAYLETAYSEADFLWN